MPMQLIETKVLATTIQMRLADNPDPTQATEWIEFSVPLGPLTLPSHAGDLALGDPLKRMLGSIQQGVMRGSW